MHFASQTKPKSTLLQSKLGGNITELGRVIKSSLKLSESQHSELKLISSKGVPFQSQSNRDVSKSYIFSPHEGRFAYNSHTNLDLVLPVRRSYCLFEKQSPRQSLFGK